MQPLYTVDHESRQTSYRMYDEPMERVTEDTPLLRRFPQPAASHRSPINTLVVTLLMMVLISGVVIGIYLLVLQSESENVLPPVEMPLQLVSRRQWDNEPDAHLNLSTSSFKAEQVIIVQTTTRECITIETCFKLLREMKANATAIKTIVPYNFLVSADGQTYEALGWHTPSPLFPEYPSALVIAFIGNYIRIPPTREQVQEAKNIIAVSQSQQRLHPSYIVIGKTVACKPTYLFDRMSGVAHWHKELSDV